jgi:ABC-type transport system substrate-binding protein
VKKVQFTYLVLSRFFARYLHRTKQLVKTHHPLKKKDLSKSIAHQNIPPREKQKTPIKLMSLHPTQQKFLLLAILGVIVAAFFWQIRLKYYHQNSLSEGLIGVYSKSNLPPSVTHLLSDPLISFDKNGNPQPKLAQEWKVNDNATLYTFKLRENLFWSDGTKVKASDLKFNLPNVEVSYPDERTIAFKLSDSFVPFPTLLVSPVFKGDSLIGVGKYYLASEEVSHEIVTKLVLVPSAKSENAKNLPDINIRFYPDEKTSRTAFMLGEVDSIIGINDFSDLQQIPSVGLKKITNYSKLVAIFYNTEDPLLSDKNLRKALTCASPQIKDEEKAKTSIQPNSWAFNDQLKEMLGNEEMAKTYLDKTNLDKDKTITLTTIPSLSKVGNEIVKSWQKLGIPVVLRVETGMPQNFQALLVPQLISADPDQYPLWHSTQKNTNLSKYFKAPRSDKDLEDGRKITDIEKRKEKYHDFQKVLQDDSPATFLYFQKINVIYRGKTEKNLNKILDLQIM